MSSNSGPRIIDDSPDRQRQCNALDRAVRKLRRLPIDERERFTGVVLHQALAANA